MNDDTAPILIVHPTISAVELSEALTHAGQVMGVDEFIILKDGGILARSVERPDRAEWATLSDTDKAQVVKLHMEMLVHSARQDIEYREFELRAAQVVYRKDDKTPLAVFPTDGAAKWKAFAPLALLVADEMIQAEPHVDIPPDAIKWQVVSPALTEADVRRIVQEELGRSAEPTRPAIRYVPYAGWEKTTSGSIDRD